MTERTSIESIIAQDAALRHQKGGTRWRQVTTKERDFVVFLKD